MKRWIFIFLPFLLLLGCAKTGTDGDASPEQVKTKQTIPAGPEQMNGMDVSEHLEQLAKSVPNVKDANCVVLGNTAIVGIDVDAHLDRSRVGTIKYSVAEALRKDPYGVHAVVTADIDIAQRIREIAADVRQGKPISGFAEELADIVGRIVPQMPKDIVPRDEQPNGEPEPKLNKKL
jgi:YhcN/YlaJ family sporulation lipoprotein